VVVPSGALLVLPSGAAVVYLAQGGKAARRPVEVGLESLGVVQILEGVSPGDSVIVRGQDSLKDGGAIRIIGGKGGLERGSREFRDATDSAGDRTPSVQGSTTAQTGEEGRP
jgi:hypothetical protein